MARNISFWSIVVCSLLVIAFITSLSLLVASIIKLLSNVIIPTVHVSKHSDITPYQDNYTVNFTNLHFFMDESNGSVPLPSQVFLKGNNFSSYSHTCNVSQYCNTHNATITQGTKCYYLSKIKHTFVGCLQYCKQYSPCYYLINPITHINVVRQNINATDTYWVGIFKSGLNYWVDLDNLNVTSVYDLFPSSYCAYIGFYTEEPWSAYYCNTPRYCLCGGTKQEAVVVTPK
nr:envelope glycoprotein 42 [Equid gammaherpesvirus 5]UTK45589.1 envelope glycoprotein 42 [Equid gammaherpesvirus 5]UTK45668.1 envelope glycoprotein 42 [Equid gammaherpesvirus 5]UTK45747.1 envelope glycoprotein 42 [Equid gammaherpesvirus 5]